MPTLREFFATEAADILARLNRMAQRLDEGAGDPAEFHRDARALRGSAQMAREDRAYNVAAALETAARSLAAGAFAWSAEVSARVRDGLADIAALVAGDETGEAADERVRRSLDQWRSLGVNAADTAVASAQTESSDASRQFLQFAAHEVAGILSEMDVSLEMLAADPRNRDPLKSILRRQRALLGAARLDELAVVAEALRATDDMARLIAKLNVPVKEEWLAVFRSARDVLASALDALRQNQPPAPTPSLSRLRVLRQELLERHGEAETGTVAPPVATPPLRSPDDVVPIEDLCYSGERALRRALELEPLLDQQLGAHAEARATVAELFDLIRLGTA